jgi:hypothetical protein
MIFRRYRLERRVKKIVKDFSDFLKGRKYNVSVQWLGSLNVNNEFGFWLQTETDQERDRLSSSADVKKEFNRLIEKYRIVKSDFSNSNYGIESQQTVTRDYQGDWRRATQ